MSAQPTATVSGSPFGVFGEHEVRVRSNRGVVTFHAPGWRAMRFSSVEAAKAKMERHPGFVRWAA